MKNAVRKEGRVYCCGRLLHHYKSKGLAYCHTCNHSYDPTTGQHLSDGRCWKCGR